MAPAALDAIPGSKLPLAIIAGIGARTADLTKLAKAKRMIKHAPADHVLQDTGWFQGADGKWRFEIPDNKARLGTIASSDIIDGQTVKAGRLGAFTHPELYDAYPQLREVMIHNRVSPNSLGTSYSNGEIGLAGQPRPKVESTLLNEFQHQVQDIEGFAKGGSPTQFAMSPERTEAVATYLDNLHNARWIRSEMKQSGLTVDQAVEAVRRQGIAPEPDAIWWARSTGPEETWIDEAIAEASRKLELAKNNGYEGYRRLAGEVEARNVQERMDSIPQDRIELPPWYTQDVQNS